METQTDNTAYSARCNISYTPSPSGLGCCPFSGGGFVVLDLLFIVALIVCWGSVFGHCFVIQYFVYD